MGTPSLFLHVECRGLDYTRSESCVLPATTRQCLMLDVSLVPDVVPVPGYLPVVHVVHVVHVVRGTSTVHQYQYTCTSTIRTSTRVPAPNTVPG
jgi:hypothetical protein